METRTFNVSTLNLSVDDLRFRLQKDIVLAEGHTTLCSPTAPVCHPRSERLLRPHALSFTLQEERPLADDGCRVDHGQGLLPNRPPPVNFRDEDVGQWGGSDESLLPFPISKVGG